jgi:DNA-binding transcriptional LysR family regulator
LVSALKGYWGKNRLRRFECVARATTLAEAALELGMDPRGLECVIGGLEDEVGGALLERTRPELPHRITPLGRRLLRQARKYARD